MTSPERARVRRPSWSGARRARPALAAGSARRRFIRPGPASSARVRLGHRDGRAIGAAGGRLVLGGSPSVLSRARSEPAPARRRPAYTRACRPLVGAGVRRRGSARPTHGRARGGALGGLGRCARDHRGRLRWCRGAGVSAGVRAIEAGLLRRAPGAGVVGGGARAEAGALVPGVGMGVRRCGRDRNTGRAITGLAACRRPGPRGQAGEFEVGR